MKNQNPPSQPLPSKEQLKKWLSGAKRLVVLGIGSELCGDDGAGILLVRTIQEKKIINRNCEIKAINGSTAPENVTGEIIAFAPTHLLVVDAADFKTSPGELRLIDPEEIQGVSFSTHTLPLKIIIDYLNKRMESQCQVVVVGIQPEIVGFGSEMTETIRNVTLDLAEFINGPG